MTLIFEASTGSDIGDVGRMTSVCKFAAFEAEER